MPQIISIENIEEGMILAEPVINGFGQTLIAGGCQLQDKHKNMLKMWNIRVVMVKGVDSENDNELSEELKKLSEEKLKKRMNWQPRNAIEEDLFLIGILRASKLLPNLDNVHNELI